MDGKIKSLTIRVNMEGSSFSDKNITKEENEIIRRTEVARMLRELAFEIEEGNYVEFIKDLDENVRLTVKYRKRSFRNLKLR